MSALARKNFRDLWLPGCAYIEDKVVPGAELDIMARGDDFYVLSRKAGASKWKESILASSAEIDDDSWRKTVSDRLVAAAKSALKE